jgi:hypothetical protein
MTDENTAVEGEFAGEAQVQEQQAPGITLNDIVAAVQIVDVVTQRGGIKGEELLSVGTVRERFVAFLRHAKEQGQEINLPPSMYHGPAEAPAEAPAEEA